ncbi:MAG: (d)CMP kinase [Clostridia bacterium]|nr:(d)CMP kinase [Clostridia bacterium]
MFAIAIDGPAGAGKSTIAKAVAKELSIIYVDTGALYRAVGLYALSKGKDTTNVEDITALLSEIKVELSYDENNVQSVLLNGENVSSKIRTPEISMAASNVSAIPSVRKFLFDTQQNIAKTHSVIMDGRDIASVVLPNADVKIFLTATPEDRARRRYLELLEKGMQVEYEDILEDVKKRDYNDSNREIAPLKPTEESIIVDTTGFELEEAIDTLLNVIINKLSQSE